MLFRSLLLLAFCLALPAGAAEILPDPEQDLYLKWKRDFDLLPEVSFEETKGVYTGFCADAGLRTSPRASVMIILDNGPSDRHIREAGPMASGYADMLDRISTAWIVHAMEERMRGVYKAPTENPLSVEFRDHPYKIYVRAMVGEHTVVPYLLYQYTGERPLRIQMRGSTVNIDLKKNDFFAACIYTRKRL